MLDGGLPNAKSSIRVGPEAQADIPDASTVGAGADGAADDGARRLWAPATHVGEGEIKDFLLRARDMLGSPSVAPWNADDATLLSVLYESGYDGDVALSRVASDRAALSGPDPWSGDDVDAFARAVEDHGDDMALLKAALPHKPAREVVARYFRVVVDEDRRPPPRTLSQRRASRAVLEDEKHARLFLKELRNAVGLQRFETAMKQLRMYDQRIISAKQLEVNVTRLLDPGRDDDVAAAFRYFLPLDADVG